MDTPYVILKVGPHGVESVRIHAATERQEKAGLRLYGRIKPVISFTAALLANSGHEPQTAEDAR